MRLKNKIAIVTGSTSGIGLSVAKLFASEGAKVVIAARKENVANEIITEIKATGGEATFIKLEVTDEKNWLELAKQTNEIYGGIHILVNNAGVDGMNALPNVNLEEWNKMIAINVTGPMMGMQACTPYMRASGGGSIVNVGSLAGMLGTPGTAYTTSKWALRGLSASAAYTFARWGIRCNTVHPGFFADTNLVKSHQENLGITNPFIDFTPLGRGGNTIELANAILFLASDESSYITGIDLPVDGGLHDTGVYSLMNKMIGKYFEGGK